MSSARPVTPLHVVPQLAAGAALARLVAPAGDVWEVRVGGQTHHVGVCPSVDPALLAEACEAGARVLIEVSGTPLIVGVVQVARTPTMDREGNLIADAQRVILRGAQEVLLQSKRSYVRLQHEDIELYGRDSLTRARGVAKILARMIDLN